MRSESRRSSSASEVLGALAQMASSAERVGDRKGARRTLETALQIHLRAHGEKSPDTAEVWSNIGLLHVADAEFTEALTCFEKALAASDCDELPPQHPRRGAAWHQ